MHGIWIWIGFIVLLIGALALDLGVFRRTHHVIGTKEALAWTAVWIGIAVVFSVFIYFAYENHWAGLGNRLDDVAGTTTDGRTAILKYLTGYVLEKSLSVDNIFVISVIFGSFADERVPFASAVTLPSKRYELGGIADQGEPLSRARRGPGPNVRVRSDAHPRRR